ncbi:MAG: TonB-dependent receptor domain-containing protein, partial [Sphingobacteriales bacterium]
GYLNTALAQTTTSSKIKGILEDAQSKPVDYASVSLLNTKDSTTVMGTLSTEAGEYHFDNIKHGTYIVKATVVGYENASSHPFTVNDSLKTILVPVLKMKTSNRNLNTVVITATKPAIEHLADRTVVNVAGTVLAAGNTAMDILERAPGVSVDKDDNISLKGKQGVTVMINDKLTYLSAQQLATLLRSTDGNTIQSIELIPNPSAKYDAAGNSGIINIKLKKNSQSGTNGSIVTTGGLGAYPNDNSTLTLNHKQGNVNIFGSLTHGDYQQGRNLNIMRTVTDGTASTYFNQYNYMEHDSHWNNYRLGADYDISPKNTIGFLVNGYINTEQDDNRDNTSIGSTSSTVDSIQRTPGLFDQSYKNFALNLNDRYKIDTLGQELGIDLDYSKFTNNSRNSYITSFLFPDGTEQHPMQYLQEQTPSTIDIHTAKADYAKPLTKTLKLEVGAKLSDVKTDNNLEAQTLQNGEYLNDTTRTNRFIYEEKIDAGYINLNKTYKNTSIQLGVRGEYTSSRGDLVTTDSIVSRKYFNLFPSAFISHTINDKNEMSFSYSRRIDRPNYEDLNPFIYYLDQYTYQKGNPFLKPQYTNNFELDYTYNKTINVSLNYSHTNNAITEIILTDVKKKATYQTNTNLQTQNSYNIDINSPFTISKWWTGNIEGNLFYLKFKSDSLFGGNLNDGQLAYMFKTTQTFTFAGFKAELYSRYNSALTYGIYHIRPRYSTDAGISRSFNDKKVNIKFAVSDIFNTNRNDLSANYSSDDFVIHQKGQSRIARLTLTYNFGNNKIKMHEHKSGAEDEAGRVKSGN